MSDETPTAGPFDVPSVRRLLQLMKKFEVSEVDLQDGEKRVRLRRGPLVVGGAMPMSSPTYAPAMAPAAPNYAPAPNAPPASAPPAAVSKLIDIKSPMVGSFYAKPAPDKDDYVKVGARVSPDTVVCKVEAMKIFNDLVSGCSGTIAEILVQNGQFVEYDQTLFRVDPG